MRSVPKLALLPCVLLTVSACATPEAGMDTTATTATDDAGVRAALEARIDEYETAALAGDYEATKLLWTEDAVLREPGLTLNGDDLQAFYDELIASGVKVTAVDIRIAEVFGHGDAAYTIGDYDETVQPQAGAEPLAFHNNWFARWELGADGAWRIDRLVVGPVDAPEGMEPPQR